MKLPFITSITAFVRRHVFLIAGIALVILAAIGGYCGWQHYQYRQSAQFAFLKFKEALQPANLEELLARVDFNALSMPLAKAAAQHYPFIKKGPHQVAHLNDSIQTALYKQSRMKEEPPKDQPDAITRLLTPFYVLPQDFLTQLSSSLSLKEIDADTALVSASVRHHLLDKTFPLHLRMERTHDGWRIRGLDNATELVAQFRAAQVERMKGQRQLLIDKNTKTRQRMEQTLPIKECTAQPGMLSDGKTLLLVVSIEAKNMGKAIVNNLNLSASIEGSKGQQMLHRYLNAVAPTMPQQPLRHSWTIEMDGTSQEAKSLLAATPLICKAAWQTLGLSSGEVLHIAEVPEPVEELQ
ncbi:MAG: translation initiation factor IF-2 [Desulfovibrio sp.]|nr:translation initiation factor IF-2 [Desulfovibrio sp.]